jgi:hypothetical protein
MQEVMMGEWQKDPNPTSPKGTPHSSPYLNDRGLLRRFVEDGCVVETGTHRELVEKQGSYYRMFESQLTTGRN